MLVAVAMVWYAFLLLTPTTSTSVNGPMADEAQCRSVEKQMRKELKPYRLACIEVPVVTVH